MTRNERRGTMGKKATGVAVAILAIFLFVWASWAKEQMKIGLLNSLTGAFALAGAEAGHRGSLIAIEMWNEKGGVGGKYEIVPVVADAQSNPDVAIREAERLINVEKVPVILGVYSSSIAVPLAPICDQNKTILWITIAISDAVVKGRNLQYVFRPQPMGSQWGKASVEMIKDYLGKFGKKEAKDLRVAVIYEDGPYGTSVQAANVEALKKYGMSMVHHEGYNHKANDLSALILKLKAAKPDVILHTGYYPDIVLFMKQARELGLTTKAIIGHGAGYANFPNLEKQLGRELVSYLYNIDTPPAQNLDLSKLKPEIGPVIKEFLKRYEQKHNEPSPPAHATMGFGHAWMLLKTLDYTVEKYGTPTPDNIRKAALELEIPEGATPCGYGMKFAPPGHEYAGQNLASYPVVMQWVNQSIQIVWPSAMMTAEPKIPMPPENPLAAK
jgi:branched-chain amino acid transport system substrate-binding protein